MISDRGTGYNYDNFPTPSTYLDIIIANEKTGDITLSTVGDIKKPSKHDLKTGIPFRIYFIDKNEKMFSTTIKIQSSDQQYSFDIILNLKYRNINSIVFWKTFSDELSSTSSSFEDILKKYLHKFAYDFFADIDSKFVYSKKVMFENLLKTTYNENLKSQGIEFSFVSVDFEISSEMQAMLDRYSKFCTYKKEFSIPTKNYEFKIIADISYELSDFKLLVHQKDDIISEKFSSFLKTTLSNIARDASADEYKKFEKLINSNNEMLNIKNSFKAEGFNIFTYTFYVKPCEIIENFQKEDVISLDFSLNSKEVINKFNFLITFNYRIINVSEFLEFGIENRKKIIENKLKSFYSSLASNYYIFDLKDLKIKVDSAEKDIIYNKSFETLGITALELLSYISIDEDALNYIRKKNCEATFSVTSKTAGYRINLFIKANYNCIYSNNLKNFDTITVEKILITNLHHIIQSVSYNYDINQYFEFEKYLNNFIYQDDIKTVLMNDGFIINKYTILLNCIQFEGPGKQVPCLNSVYNDNFEIEIITSQSIPQIIKIDYTFKLSNISYNTVDDYKEIIKGIFKWAISSTEAKMTSENNFEWYNTLENMISDLKTSKMKDNGIELITHSILIH